MKISKLAAAVALTSSLLLTACGGSDNAQTNNNSIAKPAAGQDTQVMARGQFLDSAVSFVDVYQEGKKIGQTDENGYFDYAKGLEVTFKIGEMILGTTMPKDIVTPKDFSNSNETITEILQLLQSLDADSNPENGIEIPKWLSSQFITPIDLSDDALDIDIEAIIKQVLPSLELVSAEEANKHFNDTLKLLGNLDHSLEGYWQSECLQAATDAISKTSYLHIDKLASGEFKTKAVDVTHADSNNCSSLVTDIAEGIDQIGVDIDALLPDGIDLSGIDKGISDSLSGLDSDLKKLGLDFDKIGADINKSLSTFDASLATANKDAMQPIVINMNTLLVPTIKTTLDEATGLENKELVYQRYTRVFASDFPQ